MLQFLVMMLVLHNKVQKSPKGLFAYLELEIESCIFPSYNSFRKVAFLLNGRINFFVTLLCYVFCADNILHGFLFADYNIFLVYPTANKKNMYLLVFCGLLNLSIY